MLDWGTLDVIRSEAGKYRLFHQRDSGLVSFGPYGRRHRDFRVPGHHSSPLYRSSEAEMARPSHNSGPKKSSGLDGYINPKRSFSLPVKQAEGSDTQIWQEVLCDDKG